MIPIQAVTLLSVVVLPWNRNTPQRVMTPLCCVRCSCLEPWLRHWNAWPPSQVVKLTDSDYMRTLENSIVFGLPVLMENIGNFVKQGRWVLRFQIHDARSPPLYRCVKPSALKSAPALKPWDWIALVPCAQGLYLSNYDQMRVQKSLECTSSNTKREYRWEGTGDVSTYMPSYEHR